MPSRIPLCPLRHAVGVIFVLGFAAATTLGPTAARSSPATPPPSPDSDSIAAVLPETVLDLKRTSLQSTTAPLPSGPQPSPALRPLLMFLPEALMEVDLDSDSLSGVRARYEGGPRPMLIGIIDYGTRPSQLDAVYHRLATEGHAAETTITVNGTELPAFEGTGRSDDVVPPQGVKVLVGDRFEVVVIEQPPEGVSSVADVEALGQETLEGMIERARSLVKALDLQRLIRAGDE